jgi:hypothetical protein
MAAMRGTYSIGWSAKLRDGAALAVLFSDMSHENRPAGFEVISMKEAELRVTESSRRGALMTLIRGGEERDLAAIVAMGQVRQPIPLPPRSRRRLRALRRHEEATAGRTRPGEDARIPLLHR